MGARFTLRLVFLTLSSLASPQRAHLQDLTLDELIDRVPRVEAELVQYRESSVIPATSAELHRRLARGDTLTSDQWRRLLLGTGTLRVRERWPAGEPFALSLRKPAWLEPLVIVLDPLRTDVPLRSACVGFFYRGWCGNPVMHKPMAWLHQPLGRLPLGPQALELRIELWADAADDPKGFGADAWLEQHLARDAEDSAPSLPARSLRRPRLVATSEIALAIEIVPSLDDALPPLRSAAVDEAVRRALVLVEGVWSRGERNTLRFAPAEPRDPLLEGLGLSLAVELVRAGEVHETRKLHRCESCEDEASHRQQPHECPLGLPDGFEHDARERARWSVRVRGVDEDALRSYDAVRRWSGTLELTLDELLERGAGLERR